MAAAATLAVEHAMPVVVKNFGRHKVPSGDVSRPSIWVLTAKCPSGVCAVNWVPSST